MAHGRMLNRSISEDMDVDGLPDDTCRLLFTWLIPWLCPEGRFWGEPRMVLTKVLPWRRDLTEQQIDGYLNAMAAVGLIVRYRVNGKRYIYFPSFDKNQPGLRKDREAPSPFPPLPTDDCEPTPELLRSESGVTPAQVKVKEEVKEEVKEIEAADAAPAPKTPAEPKKATEPKPIPKPPNETYLLAQALASVCRMDFGSNQGRLLKEAKVLGKASPKPTPELLQQHYGLDCESWWFKVDWRGQEGEDPSPATVRETWGKWLQPPAPRNGASRNGYDKPHGITGYHNQNRPATDEERREIT